MRPEQVITVALRYVLSALSGALSWALATAAQVDGYFSLLMAAGVVATTHIVCSRVERGFWDRYRPGIPSPEEWFQFLKGLSLSVALAFVGGALGVFAFRRDAILAVPASALMGSVGFFVGQLVFYLPWPYIRGRLFITEERAIAIAESQRRADDQGIRFGKLVLPTLARNLLFLLLGSPRTGKTTVLEGLIKSIAPMIGKGIGGGTRMVIADPRTENLSRIAAVVLSAKIMSFHPFDEPRRSTARIVRCCAYDIAGDTAGGLAIAETIAAALLPMPPQAHEPFWVSAAQAVISHTLWALRLSAGDDFGLADLIRVLQTRDALKYLLGKYADTRSALVFLQDNEVGEGVKVTVAAEMAHLEPAAWAWDNSPHKVRLEDFIDGEGVLVLPNHPVAERALQAVNRIIVTRLGQMVLSPAHAAKRKKATWFFLDETNNLGAIPNIQTLITAAAGAGGIFVLAIHSDSLLRMIYGEASAALRGQIGNVVSFRESEPETAKMIEQLFGSMEMTIGGKREVKPVVSADELKALLWSDGPNGIEAFMSSAVVGGVWKTRFTPEEMAEFRIKSDPNVEDFVPRPAEDLRPREFTTEDLDRLGIPHEYLNEFTANQAEQEKRFDEFRTRYEDLGLLGGTDEDESDAEPEDEGDTDTE